MKTVKRSDYFISAAVLVLALASCGKTEIEPANRQVTFVANTESSIGTRTSLSGNDKSGYQVVWREGDRIILDNSAESKFYLLSGAGTTKGTFHGSYAMDEGSYDAYYTTASSIYSLSLPDETECVAGDVILTAPMKGRLTFEGGSVSSEAEFKNLCGLLRLSLKGEGTVMKIRVYADQYLYGEFEVNEEGSAVISYKPENDYVTQNCRGGVDLASDKASDFYIPLPPNDYTGVKIEITDIFGGKVTKTMKSTSQLNITRALITPVNLTVSGLGKRSDVPEGSLYGEFTVKDPDGVRYSGDERKVYITRGNLFWDGDSFELEANQEDYPRGWNAEHIGHFYFHMNASDACATDYEKGVQRGTYVLFTNNQTDPEKPNEEVTVDGLSGKYRALTSDEWLYLFNHHACRWAQVNGVYGYVIAPDHFSGTLAESYADDNDLLAENLVFLPAAGYRNFEVIVKIKRQQERGCYLPSYAQNDDLYYPKNVFFSSTGYRIGSASMPSDAQCIRLALDTDIAR